MPGDGRSPNGPADEEHQLLPPMALAGGREFVTMPVTQHFESHVEILKAFLSQKIAVSEEGNLVRVRVA